LLTTGRAVEDGRAAVTSKCDADRVERTSPPPRPTQLSELTDNWLTVDWLVWTWSWLDWHSVMYCCIMVGRPAHERRTTRHTRASGEAGRRYLWKISRLDRQKILPRKLELI